MKYKNKDVVHKSRWEKAEPVDLLAQMLRNSGWKDGEGSDKNAQPIPVPPIPKPEDHKDALDSALKDAEKEIDALKRRGF